jgi:beta-glucanase (GH16 family)
MNKKIYLKLLAFLFLPIIIFSCKKIDNEINKSLPVPVKLNNTANLNSSLNLNDYIFYGQDDFNGNTLDTSVWDYYAEGQQRASSVILRNNVSVNNGNLYLVTKPYLDRFSSAFISTELTPQGYFKYGYFEIRANLPKGIGNVGSFWLLANGMGATYPIPNPSIYGTEIDVFEYSYTNPNNLYISLHWNGYDVANGALESTFTDNIPGIETGYHTYALEWTPKEYIIYVDGVERIRTNQIISHTEEFLLLSCQTEGFGGSNLIGPWPDTTKVDYIKVYKRKPEVRLYGACDYNGWVSEGLQFGNYTTAQLTAKGIFNNETSSIEVPQGWKVTAFDGDNLTGDSAVILNNIQCFSILANDKISSLRITPN